MNYLSLSFLFFFFFVYIIYWNLNDRNKRILLVLSSSVFYSYFSFNFLIHLYIIILVNYLILRFSGRSAAVAAVVFNLLNLGFFKYFYFFMEMAGEAAGISLLADKTSLNSYLSSLSGFAAFEIVLPLTISYYTFQFISLAVDLKKGVISKIPSLYDMASYILFFPVMIAGPILRFEQIIHQFKKPVMTETDMNRGLWLLIRGIFKKAIISDYVAAVIYPVFGSADNYSGFSLLLTSYFFAVHLYLDFSGLTDIARGLGALLGFGLPENFKAPFFMNSFGDFWRRWHLTFSFWIRDYIYIPLGGSRKGAFRNSFNLAVTFALGGIWHGANLNFFLWGILTGIYLSVERLLEPVIKSSELTGIKKIIHYLVVLHIYFISWILFFTPDVSSAISIIKSIVVMKPGLQVEVETGIYAILLTFLFHMIEEKPEKFAWFDKYKTRTLALAGVIIILLLVQTGNQNIDFFYSQF